MTFGQNVIEFYNGLITPKDLPKGVEVLFPFNEEEVKSTIEEFNTIFFNDSSKERF